ncbi:MAG: hypothetical protein E7071_09060 [Bacteroidales bacterium]|nr:hypothetical protein [Bacteroidales bacterium]
MKKGIILLVIALAIVGAIIFVMSRVHKEMGELTERTADSFVPESSDVIVKENIEGSFLLLSRSMESVVSQEQLNIVEQGLDSLKRKGILKSRKAERVAIDLESGQFVAAYKSDKVLTIDILMRCFETMQGKVVKVNDDYPICSIKDSTLFLAEYDKWVLLSNSASYIANSLQLQPQRDSVAMAINISDVSSDAPLNIFVKGREGDMVLDLYTEDDEKSLLMQGYCNANGSNWVEALEGQVSRISDFDNNFPINTVAAEWLSLSDLQSFYSEVGAFVKRDSNEMKFGSFVQLCDTLLSGDVAQLVVGKENFLVLDVADSGVVAKSMEAIYGDKRETNISLSSRSLFGSMFREVEYTVMALRDNLLILAQSQSAIRGYDVSKKSNLLQQEWYKSYKMHSPTRFSYTRFLFADYLNELYKGDERGLAHKVFNADENSKLPYGAIGVQGEYMTDRVFVSLIASENSEIKIKVEAPKKSVQKVKTESVPTNKDVAAASGPKGNWRKSVSGTVVVGPVKVKNHNTKGTEWIVQDSKSKLYLFTNDGKKLWEAPVDGKILSDIVQIDRYKNGKLQYLFSTENKIYLVDRNGVMVTGYPIKLAAKCSQGITLCDYDKNRNYRIFVPRADRKIDLYDAEGKRVAGWSVPTLNSAPVSPVYHFRVGGKDYIVVADNSKLYIYDRRGNIRVNCNVTLNLKSGTTIQLQQRQGKVVMAIKSGKNNLYYIDFSGKKVL